MSAHDLLYTKVGSPSLISLSLYGRVLTCVLWHKFSSSFLNLFNSSNVLYFIWISRFPRLTSAVYIILANMDEQLCSWTFNFRKVVRQRNWGEVVGFISAFWSVSAVHLSTQQWKNYELVNIWPSYCQNKKVLLWSRVFKVWNREAREPRNLTGTVKTSVRVRLISVPKHWAVWTAGKQNICNFFRNKWL